jgi:hydrogenase expression/formation protein HypE
MAIMAARENLGFETPIVSDTAALHGLIEGDARRRPGCRVLRDPTRGGVATTLNEIARQSGVGIDAREAALPVNPAVAAACEFLGLDPLYVANEGKLLAIVAPTTPMPLLAAMRAHPLGARAAIASARCIADPERFVQMTTTFGGRRIVDWLTGDQLPRIC